VKEPLKGRKSLAETVQEAADAAMERHRRAVEESETAELQNGGDRRASQPAFPDEPFPCPACGQMLAASCRFCVACKQPIDPAHINSAIEAQRLPQLRAPSVPVVGAPFSWTIFFVVLLVWLILAGASEKLLGPTRAQWLMLGVVLVSSLWVLQDAHAKSIAKPFRWAIGSFLLWIVFFPWYLSRRKVPAAPCRLVEAEFSPLVRALLFGLLVLFLFAAALTLSQWKR
jgi:hypothetical protein